MNAESTTTCPKCGKSLPEDAPQGLCPACLAAAINFNTETVGAPGVCAAPAMSPEELAPHFPQLEIIEFLGRGGMGVVYKARQKSLNRLVALKLLAPERADDAKFAERFEKEAHALAALNNPDIVTIYDFGQAAGFYFLLMEYIDGVNLRQAMQAGRFTPEQALAIVPPVCEALQYAHEQGIVHRDIKPENLLMDKDGRVKIADFGIAKMIDAEAPAAGEVELSQPFGTPAYSAPEQTEDPTHADHRVDIYSLGVVLYELLTGEVPQQLPEPPSSRVQVDVRLDEIVLRALETKPEMRFATAEEFRTQLREVTLPPSKPATLKSSACYVSSPEHLATLIGRFFYVYTGKGKLQLDSNQLTFYQSNSIKTVIPLNAIRDLSTGMYPKSAAPFGLMFISITWEESGVTRQHLFTPRQGSFKTVWKTNEVVTDWFTAIQDAVRQPVGLMPPTTPADELNVPQGKGFPWLFFFVGSLLTPSLIFLFEDGIQMFIAAEITLIVLTALLLLIFRGKASASGKRSH